MVTPLTRKVVRETSFVDYRTRKPIILTLCEGGKLIRLRPKGRRWHYVVTVEQIWIQGAANKAAEKRAARKQKQKERKKA